MKQLSNRSRVSKKTSIQTKIKVIKFTYLFFIVLFVCFICVKAVEK